MSLSEASAKSGWATRYLSLIDAINQIVRLVLIIAMVAIFGATLLQVIVRFLLTQFGIRTSVPWAEELARCILIWIVFLGAAVGARTGMLVAVQFFIKNSPRPIGVLLQYAAHVVSMLFYALLIWLGIVYVELGMVEHMPVMGLPKIYVYLALPVGAALLLVNTLAFIIERRISGKGIIVQDAETAPTE